MAGFNLPPQTSTVPGFVSGIRGGGQLSSQLMRVVHVSGAGLCDTWGVRRLNEESAAYVRNTACRGDAGPSATLVKCVSVQVGCHDQMETVDCCQNSAGARCRELIMTRPKYKLLSTMKAVSHRRAEAHKQTRARTHARMRAQPTSKSIYNVTGFNFPFALEFLPHLQIFP